MKKILTIVMPILCILTLAYSANAYVEEVSTEPYVDKFKPSTGLKIKESNIAAKMENATREAAYGEKKEKKQWAKKRTTPKKQNNSTVRSYKWF